MPEYEYAPSDVSTRMKALRLRLKLSQQQFADLTDVPVTLFKQWESGIIQPPASYWQRILVAETEGLQMFSCNGRIAGRVAEGRLANSNNTVRSRIRRCHPCQSDVKEITSNSRPWRSVDGS
jgi:DNA-binding XRE family transcriptional regulator